jgi:hypothetical protein
MAGEHRSEREELTQSYLVQVSDRITRTQGQRRKGATPSGRETPGLNHGSKSQARGGKSVRTSILVRLLPVKRLCQKQYLLL